MMSIIKHTFTVSASLAFTVRTVLHDGNPWFIAKDVAEALGYKNPAEAVSDHCKRATNLPSDLLCSLDGRLKIIPESDVYRLAMRSKLESAELFQDWVCEEVLPSIRKHGAYVTGMEELPELAKTEIAANARAEAHTRLLRIYNVAYTRESYTKKEWDKVGEAYTAAEAIVRVRGDETNVLAFCKEFASQLMLHGLAFRKHYERGIMARLSEPFRRSLEQDRALKKHKGAYTSW